MQNVPAGLQDVLEHFVHGGTFCPSASKYAPALLFYWSIQKELAELSGVKQPAIARIESLKSTPQLDTLLKVLAPLGYTLSITPIKEK